MLTSAYLLPESHPGRRTDPQNYRNPQTMIMVGYDPITTEIRVKIAWKADGDFFNDQADWITKQHENARRHYSTTSQEEMLQYLQDHMEYPVTEDMRDPRSSDVRTSWSSTVAELRNYNDFGVFVSNIARSLATRSDTVLGRSVIDNMVGAAIYKSVVPMGESWYTDRSIREANADDYAPLRGRDLEDFQYAPIYWGWATSRGEPTYRYITLWTAQENPDINDLGTWDVNEVCFYCMERGEAPLEMGRIGARENPNRTEVRTHRDCFTRHNNYRQAYDCDRCDTLTDPSNVHYMSNGDRGTFICWMCVENLIGTEPICGHCGQVYEYDYLVANPSPPTPPGEPRITWNWTEGGFRTVVPSNTLNRTTYNRLIGVPRWMIPNEDGSYRGFLCQTCSNEFCWASRGWSYCACCDCSPQYDDSDDDDTEYNEHDEVAIHSYSFKPVPAMKPVIPTRRDGLYLGMEVEVSFSRAHRGGGPLFNWITDEMNRHWYVKSDGSVVSGWEWVSHPAEPEWWHKNRSAVIDEVFNTLRTNFGARDTHPSCGGHMHVSKEAFDTQRLWKFLVFHRDLSALCAIVGGREESANYGSFDSFKGTQDRFGRRGSPWNAAQAAKDKHIPGISRSAAINMLPASTIELRYPAGTTVPTQILKNIEWVEALVDFVDETHITDVQKGALKSPEYFLEFVENRDEYPNLAAWLTERAPVIERVYATTGGRVEPEATTTDVWEDMMLEDEHDEYCDCDDCVEPEPCDCEACVEDRQVEQQEAVESLRESLARRREAAQQLDSLGRTIGYTQEQNTSANNQGAY